MPFWAVVVSAAWAFVFGSNFLRYQEGKIGLFRFLFNVTFRFAFVITLILLMPFAFIFLMSWLAGNL